MSKAFTSEETPETSVVGRQVQRAAPGHERPITREGHAQLVERLNNLDTTRAGKSKEELESLDHQRALLEATVASVRPIDTSASVERVSFGHWVSYQLSGGPSKRVRLVGVDEVEVSKGLVSVQSPLGRALLGLRVGDAFEFVRPTGVDEGQVLSISAQP